MTITTVTEIEEAPLRSESLSNTAYRMSVETFLTAVTVLSQELGVVIPQMNADIATVNDQAEQVEESRDAVQATYALIVAESMGGLTGSSATSVTIGTGAKSFAASPGKLWRPSLWVMIRSAANAANWMTGPITSYDVADGDPLGVDVRQSNGSGTFTDWLIYPTYAPTPSPNLVIASKTDTASTTSTSWVDTGLQVTITLTDPSCRVFLNAAVAAAGVSTDPTTFRFTRAGTPIIQGDAASSRTRGHFCVTGNSTISAAGHAVDVPGSVGPHTYKLEWRTPSGTSYLNRTVGDGDNATSARLVSTLTAMQVGAV